MSKLIARIPQASDISRAVRFKTIRALSEQLAAPLSPEDQTVQSMPDASPTKWHLAHTTWFFETFLLLPHQAGYRPFHPAFSYLFNSYYEAVGPRHPRPQRGLITRPSVEEVLAYRQHVTAAMLELLQQPDSAWASLVELGLHHEQQHQELLLMDIKHLLSLNPLKPAYLAKAPAASAAEAAPLGWIDFEGGMTEIGHDGSGFAFDNEGPRHRVWIEPFALATRLVTCGEYAAFIEDGGYRRPELWLSAGWDCVRQRDWEAPLYWERDGASWSVFTLAGLRPMQPHEPVCHVSAYEAAAYAKWAGKRLAREGEWEMAAADVELAGNLLDDHVLHPAPVAGPGLRQMIGDVWEWTASPYVAYPGYREPEGAVGEYNGKFMANQMVLRGGCAVTPRDHIRTTYRNFFPPDARWMFGGIRLAEDLR
ncbi:ergothioneine biosynthesis protein EgtB [Enhydrobacter aerosaccus]|uniref:Ergothioneine biosynthesis protein EgtB n=1 Tax=Enhydrobacter aerosaccus TaxID=225324 RepID=A0A1T4T9N8_9HYPH|nr:ergothioneine biosynthesis protein EgtB [Enhydrobacter aerosaccus]SKA37103.1 ergothioneine biosynthesis protein EgtB [Enhydrobacter aerosaccus]